MTKYRQLLFAGIATLYILLAGVYSITTPLFESPDEIWHYEYVRWLVEGNGLASPEDVGHAPWHQEGSQPPLYYLTAAALTSWIPTNNASQVIRYNPHAAVGQADSFGNKNVMTHGPLEHWPWQGVTLAAHAARFFSILLGAITVWATYRTGLAIAPATPSISLLAAAIVAFNPQFLFLTSSINNDNLVTCVCAVGVWYGIRFIQTDQLRIEAAKKPADKPYLLSNIAQYSDRTIALFGVLAGLAALSKLSGLLLSIFVAVTITTVSFRRRSWPIFFRWGIISAVAMIVTASWWYIRNWLLFGDPLALSAMFDILPRRAEPPSMDELIARAQGIWYSVWAVFGWFNVIVSSWIYRFYSALTVIGIAGLLLSILSGKRLASRHLQAQVSSSTSSDGRATYAYQLSLLAVWVSMLLISLWSWAQMRYPQGRLLFPALSATAVLLAIGLNFWLPRQLPGSWRAAPWRAGLQAGLVGAMLFISLWVPNRFIASAYQPIERESVVEFSVMNTAGDSGPSVSIPKMPFGSTIQLADAALSTDELQPGQKLALQLTWRLAQPENRDLSVFIHLIDENNILQAQRDSYPGQGNLPTSSWTSGKDVVDLHLIDIPITVPSPAKLKVTVGLYDFTTGERLLINGSDHWTIGFVRLSPPAGDGTYPNSVFVNFDDQIALLGFQFDRFVMAPGETLTLKLWWEALDAPLRDIKVFTHLVFPPDATWAQDDDRPRAGTSKTNTWAKGQQVEDQYEMTLPPDAPPGVYFVEIGLYDGETYKRLKVNFSEKGTVIGQVRVTE